MERNKTKHISKVAFSRIRDTDAQWFQGELPLNPGLVAIKGNKGSGKTALADILALLGNTHIEGQYFSFLNKERFLAPRLRWGEGFQGTISWLSGQQNTRLFADSPDKAKPELVKYIPQNYLESICSEVKERGQTKFNKELMDVIYSHVTDADRLESHSLDELIAYRTAQIEKRIRRITDQLTLANQRVASLEEQATEEFRASVQAQLDQRLLELDVHDSTKPAEVLKPQDDLAAQEQVTKLTHQLAELQVRMDETAQKLEQARDRDRVATSRMAAADKLLARIRNFEAEYETFLSDSRQDIDTLGLDVSKLVSVTLDVEPIMSVRHGDEVEQKTVRASLDPDDHGSLPRLLSQVEEESKQLREQLDEPNRKYQEYLQALRAWEDIRLAIDGSGDDLDSVQGLQKQLSWLDQLPSEIEGAKRKREEILHDIFALKEQVLAEYRQLYRPVHDFIRQENHTDLKFAASITVEGLTNTLLEMIHQGRVGSFYGQEGRKRLEEMVGAADFTSVGGVSQFISQVLDALNHDLRDVNGREVAISSQLLQGLQPTDVYNYLFGLSYLQPQFELLGQNKPLDHLSPGERGVMLLIFYLLLDKRDVPLIIDQPEENLGNQTIATTLVPLVQKAKARRQVIMVTHNPNPAVVCDADQVIHASLDKSDGNRVIYKAGSLEEPMVAQTVVDVLEGTKPAFDLRDAKYSVLEH